MTTATTDDLGTTVSEESEELLELVAQYQRLNRAQRRRIANNANSEIRSLLANVERDMALRRSPGAMAAILTDGKEKQAKHLDLIDRVFRDIAAGRPRKVLITMPPRHGKSRRAARWAPLWYLARHPNHRVMVASYSADLADDHGRWIRDAINAYGPQLGIALHAGSKAANRFDLADPETGERLEGGLVTAGVGGGLTGKGAHLALVDDPIKDDADAQSPTMRKRLWEWWTSVLLTRIEPGGSVIVIQCMTGDTPVMMGDGTEKPLRNIRPGDTVATYENGEVTSATVRNWANQGPDSILAIKMKSGTVVRANARHPFLTIQDGVEVWQRTDMLKMGSRIQRVTGVSGEASSVLPKTATSQQSARGCATRTTTSSVGRMGCAPRPSTQQRVGQPTCVTATALTQLTTTACLQSKADSVPSVSSLRPRRTPEPTGMGNSASTIAMTPAGCAHCSVTTATLPSATERPRKSFCPQQPIYAIEVDEVVEVVPCGREDVYDLQIDRTENFIANGLVSHNTRWHEDDLAGRILAGDDADDWTILDLPAIADSEDDPLGREIGRPLWPVRYGLKALAKIRRSVGERVWWSLFQQKPRPMSGGVWKQDWIDDHRISTAVLRSINLDRIVIAVDPAGGDSSVNDEVGITAAGSAFVESLGAHHSHPEMRDEFYVLDDKSASLGADQWGIVACQLAIDWQADAIVVESNFGGDMTAQVITQAWQELARKGMTGRMLMPRLIPVNAKQGKRLRAEPIAQLYGQGRVHHVGQFTKLEGQMVTWMPGMDSPDRMDSAVHALTELAEIDGLETTMDTYERGDPPGRR
ncbi:terminase family protein [Streptomyces anulatus]|uniref:terminase large subunit domain-containing protein n=1 Tax=Streptomyces anulatus TaxID=1892 RepID=UPI0022558E44|nr:terminase family protein [Streptomyces anulatus]MCX4606831.1 terminase family protein [Streptomyces anulatus]WSI82930.1 terminase family protein [Streptomyces anulatus]